MKLNFYIISLLIIVAGLKPLFGQDPFEPNDTYETAATVTCGQQFSAYIQEQNDADWYEIVFEETGVLKVEVTSVPSSIDLNLEVYQLVNNDLALVSTDREGNSSGGQSLFSYAVAASGTYLILIEDEGGSDFSDTDSYEVTLSCTPNALEMNQIWEEAALIPADTCFEANIFGDNHLYEVYNDVDWFEVEITEAGVLEVAVTSVDNNLDLDVGIYQIINYDATLIANDREGNSSGGQSLFANAVLMPGTYLIRVRDEGDTDYAEDNYIFCTDFTANALEVNQTWEEAAPIPADTCFEANIYGDNHLYDVYNDVDWFEVEITEPGVLEVAVTSVPSSLDLDVRIYQIINYDETLIADDREGNSSSGQSLFANAVLMPGTYLIRVRDEGDTDYAEEHYIFCTDFTANALEVNHTWEEAALIPADTCFEANIYGDNHLYDVHNDVDWFELEITEPGVLEVSVTSVPSSLDLDVGIYQIINYDETLIADDREGNSSGGQSLFANAVIVPGTYLIRVRDEGNTDYAEENYMFCTDFTANALEVNQTWEEAAPIPTDTCFEANIYGDNHLYEVFNDVDWFEVEIIESGMLNTSVTLVPNNMDLNLGIFQFIDNEITQVANDGVGNASGGQDLSCSMMAEPGLYYVVVEDEGNSDFNEETYTICMDVITGIENPSAAGALFTVYPNPCSEQLYINPGPNDDVSQIHIVLLDHLGRIIIHKENADINAPINVQQVPAGVYFLRVQTSNGILSHKVLIQ
jgi:hypothetical protein